MPETGFLYPVHEMLEVAPGSRIVMPEQAPSNAPVLISMLTQMTPRRLNVLGAIVALDLVADRFEEICRTLAPEYEDLDVRIVARVVENTQARLANRLADVSDVMTEAAAAADQLETIYHDTLDADHGAAWMIAQAAQHTTAATSIGVMHPNQIPQQDQAVMLEAAHVVLFAAQSRSRSQPHPVEGTGGQKKLDLLNLTQPGEPVLAFLSEWWSAFRRRMQEALATPQTGAGDVPAQPVWKAPQPQPRGALSQIPAPEVPAKWNLIEQLEQAWPANYPETSGAAGARDAVRDACARIAGAHADLGLRLSGGIVVSPGDKEGRPSSVEVLLATTDPHTVSARVSADWPGDVGSPTLAVTLTYNAKGRSLMFSATSVQHADPQVVTDIAVAAMRIAAIARPS